MGLLLLSATRKALKKATDAASLARARLLLLLLTTTKDVVHHVFQPAKIRILPCIWRVRATEQAVVVLLACVLLTHLLYNAFGNRDADGDLGKCFHQ